MRLRFVLTCHFGKSEFTHLREIIKKYPAFNDPRSKHRLHPQDVVLLISHMGNQLIFLHNFEVTSGTPVLRSTRLRLTNNATWNPLMLATYADEVGLRLEGLKSFEEHIRAKAAAK